jgi:hypothetical protein
MKKTSAPKLSIPIPTEPPPAFGKKKLLTGLVIGAVVFAVAFFATSVNTPIGRMGGMTEEYVDMGQRYVEKGQFYDDPTIIAIFRPPGYVMYSAGIFFLTRVVMGDTDPALVQHYYSAIYLSQCLLVAFASMILFWLLISKLRYSTSIIFATLFGINPYICALAGMLHYEVLHIFLTVAGIATLYWGYRKKSAPLLGGSGLIWGLTTLTRPMTFILPAFVLLLFIFQLKSSWKRHLLFFAAFCLGMVLTIAPYTIRNYSLTGRVIPVNAQSNIAVWASTQKELDTAPNYFRWWNIWYYDGVGVYQRVTGISHYNYYPFVKNIIILEDEYRRLALENIRNQPFVYLHNMTGNFMSFNGDINSVFIKFYEAAQVPGFPLQYKKWLGIGNPQDFYSEDNANLFKYIVATLSILSLLGLIFAVKKREPFLAVPALVYACFAAAHTISYLDIMYYYIKMPFLFIFAAYLVDLCFSLSIPVTKNKYKLSMGHGVSAVLVAMCLYLTIAVIFIP